MDVQWTSRTTPDQAPQRANQVKNRPICISLSQKQDLQCLCAASPVFGLLLQSILKCLAGLESRNGRSRDVDRSTGSGIVSCAGRSLTRFKCTKAGEPDRVTFHDSVGNRSKQRINNCGGILFWIRLCLRKPHQQFLILVIFRDLLSRIALLLNRLTDLAG